ncbi:MAG: SOS response-associated peptidase family protein [Akkermansiaceae bacterium]|nr:SOS response-associated peptidase family protein [Akkermansiaceae bacterium]
MCSVYEFGRGKKKAPQVINADGFDNLDDDVRLIRRTNTAPVYLSDGDVRMMRWGYERPGLGVVNNTRSENFGSPMWRDSIEHRRCLIPVTAFYEWSGSKGNKRTHRFTSPADEWLWMAGIWEQSVSQGECFSMITTTANSLMAPIHHRMPAVLSADELNPYLNGELMVFTPKPDTLLVNETTNPLLKNPPSHLQGELF